MKIICTCVKDSCKTHSGVCRHILGFQSIDHSMSSWLTRYLVWIHCRLKRTPSFLNRVTHDVLFDMGFSRPIWKHIILPCRPTPGVFERHCAAHAATSLTHKGFPLLPQAAKRRKNMVQKHFVDLKGGAFLAAGSMGHGKNTISNWEHHELRFT